MRSLEDSTTGSEEWRGAGQLRGQLDLHQMHSKALEDNLLGDPATRSLNVYTPPGMREGDNYPVIYVTPGYAGQLEMWHNRVPFRRTFPELVDDLFADPALPRAFVVFVDGWTRYGGSQFVDSAGTGNYHTYLCHDVVAWVDEHLPTRAEPRYRAITGKSSGGYGSMISAMTRPDVFGALATHAGDALFDVSYISAIPQVVRRLRDDFGGSYEAFLEYFWSADVPLLHELDELTIELYGYASAFSSDDDGTVSIPFDTQTGRMDPDIWARWLDHDPVRMASRNADSLQSLHSIWVDAGARDEFYLDLGATAFHQELLKIGIEPQKVHFELFDATHARIEYRYPLAMAWILRRMEGDA